MKHRTWIATAALMVLAVWWGREVRTPIPATAPESASVPMAIPTPSPTLSNEPGAVADKEIPSVVQGDDALKLEQETVLSLLRLPSDFLQTEALYRLAAGSDVARLQRHLRDVPGLPRAGDRYAAALILYLRYADLDADGALEHLRESRDPNRSNILYSLFNGWAKYDLDGAISRFESLERESDRQVARNGIVVAMEEGDPGRLAEIMARLGAPGVDLESRQLHARAQQDPAGTLEDVLRLARSDQRANLIAQIAHHWASRDPEAALSAAESIDNDLLRQRFRATVLAQMAQLDPDRLLELLALAESRMERQHVINSAVGQLSGHDPQTALDLALQIDSGDLSRQALNHVFSNWSRQDPRAAAQALAEMDPRLIAEIGYQVAYQYALHAPKEALQWARQVEGRRGNLWENVVHAIAENDTALALDLVDAMDPSPQRSQLLAQVLGTLASSRPEDAVALLDGMTPGPSQDQARQQVFYNWSNQDPQSALEWLIQQPVRHQINLVHSAAYQLAQTDLELALAYAEEFEGPAQQQWISALIDPYGRNDPQAAADWLSQYRDQDHYPNWLANLASTLVRVDPEMAIAMIDEIADPDGYQNALQIVTDQWSAHDAPAVARWLERQATTDHNIHQYGSIARNWYHFDPDAATRWALDLSTTERDAALLGLFQSGVLESAAARRLINRISTQEGRWHALTGNLYQFIQYDLEGFRSVLASASLSTEYRDRIERMIAQQLGSG